MNFHIEFTESSVQDIEQYKEVGNQLALRKIYILLEELTKHPFDGIGKPEQLKHELSGKWSRIINQKDRLVYEVVGDIVYILSAKGHY